MRIGFIGAGLMGWPTVQRLIAAGHHLFVWGRRYDTAEPLRVLDAGGNANPSEGADTADVEEVLLGATGALQRMAQA